jgi:hypothetical protein
MVSFLWREYPTITKDETKVKIQNAFYDVLKGVSKVDNFTSEIDASLNSIKEGTKEELINFIQNAIDEKMEDTTIEKAFHDAGILEIYKGLSKGSEKSQDMGYIKRIMKNFDKSLKDLESSSSLQRQIELRSKDVKPDSIDLMSSNFGEDRLKDVLLQFSTEKGESGQGLPFVSTKNMKTAEDLIRFQRLDPNKEGEEMIRLKNAIIFKTKKDFIDWQELTKKNLLLEEGVFSSSRKSNRKDKKEIDNLILKELDIESNVYKNRKELEEKFQSGNKEEKNRALTELVFNVIRENELIIREYLTPILNNPYLISEIILKITPSLKKPTLSVLELTNTDMTIIFKYLTSGKLTNSDLKDVTKEKFIQPLFESVDGKMQPIRELPENKREEFLEENFGKNEFVDRVLAKVESSPPKNIDRMKDDFRIIINELKKEGKPVKLQVYGKGFSIEEPVKAGFKRSEEKGIKESDILSNLTVDITIEFKHEKILRIEPTTLKSEDSNKVEAFMDKLADIVDELEDLR